MKTMKWTLIDKSCWPVGPWSEEADKMQWQDKATGLPCLIHRNYAGSLCGYVGVAAGHPYYKEYYGEANVEEKISVHGGLTYSGFCQDEKDGICHIPEKGEPDKVWWFGFDCAHAGDLSPRIPTMMPHETYKDVAYVKKEVGNLAKQLKGILK